jgi:solute:Na+ symporter, SSS family
MWTRGTSRFAAIISGGAFLAGGLVHLFTNRDVLATLPNGGMESVGALVEVNYDLLAPKMLVDALPETLLVLVMLLILSASISTLPSLVLVAASVVTVDFTKAIFRPQISARTEVILMRVLVVMFIVVSVILAQLKVGFIVTMMSVSWGTIAGTFLGPYFWTLFGRRSTPFGAWVGLLGGLAICLGLNFAHSWDAKYATLWAVLAMLASLLLVPLVSLVTKPMPAEHLERRYGEGAVEPAAAAVAVEQEGA